MAGRERRRGECQNALGFYFGAKRRLDLATVRAVAERRPPERSAVEKSRAATEISVVVYGFMDLGVARAERTESDLQGAIFSK